MNIQNKSRSATSHMNRRNTNGEIPLSAHKIKQNISNGQENEELNAEGGYPEIQLVKKRPVTSHFNPNQDKNEELFANKWTKLNEQNKFYFDTVKPHFKSHNTRQIQSCYKKMPLTEYQAKIVPEKRIDVQPMIPIDYHPYKDEREIDYRTTQRVSYESKSAKNPVEECVQINRDNLMCGYQLIDHNTSYGKNFFEKTKYNNVKFLPIEQTLVPHPLKMDLKTESMKISGRQNKPLKIVNFAYERSKKFQPPLGVDIPMFSNTWYRTSNQNWYKDKTVEQLAFNKHNFRIKNTHISEQQIVVTPLNFQTTSQQDYTYKAMEKPEPAPQDGINRLPRGAYMYRLYNETKGKFS